MNKFKLLMLAAVLALPFSVAAQAADIQPDVPSEVDTSGLYLRGDLGWSFLEWSGGDDDNNFVAGGGIGYQFNDIFRADVTVDWSGDYEVAPGAEISTTAVMANGYLDWANDTMFTPYVGAGAGWGWVDGTGSASSDDGVALGLTAGVAVNLTDNLAADFGYRFRDIMISGDDPMEHQLTTGIRFKF